MNTTELAQRLLLNFAPEERAIPENVTYPGRHAEVRGAINGALQELYGDGGPWVREDRLGALLRPPASISITVTNGSVDATISGGDWKDWFPGCAISISGSAVDNEIRNDSAAVKLRVPFDGPSGTVSATVFHNCITLPSTILEPTGNVTVDGHPLAPSVTTDARARVSEFDYAFHKKQIGSSSIERVGQSLGRPLGWRVETYAGSPTAAPTLRMRIFPAPDRQMNLEYSAKLAPPVVVGDLSSSAALPVPFQFVETLLLPLSLKKLTGSPFFSNPNGVAAIEAGYQTALRLIKDLNPRSNPGRRLRAPYEA